MKLNYSIRDVLNYRKLEWEKSNDFYYLTDIPSAFEPNFFKPNYFSFGLINKGCINIEIDNKKHVISNRSLMIYRPEQIIQISQIHPQTKGVFILFTKQFLDYLNENIFSLSNQSFLSNQFESHIKLEKIDYCRLKKKFNKIFDLINETHDESWEYVVRNLTSALVYESNEILKRYLINNTYNSYNTSDNVTYNFKKLVGINYKSIRNLDFYAKSLNISVNYLHKLVKKQTGETPTTIINSKLLNEAKSLLAYSNNSISEIAFLLNFCCVQAFSKFFKNQTGISPMYYRKNSKTGLN